MQCELNSHRKHAMFSLMKRKFYLNKDQKESSESITRPNERETQVVGKYLDFLMGPDQINFQDPA